MNSKLIVSILTAVMFNLITSYFFSQAIGVPHMAMFGVQMVLALIPLKLTGCLADGLNKEIWLPGIIEHFIPETSFVNEARNLDAWTDNGFLNLQEAGVDPDVIVNNEVWPIPIIRREDVP